MPRALSEWEEPPHNGIFPKSLPGMGTRGEDRELLPALVCLCLGVANRSHWATMMAEMPRTQTMER